jgi:hypothetical protein
MAAYMGRDVSKLKTKGGKWKYVPPSSTYLLLSASPRMVLADWFAYGSMVCLLAVSGTSDGLYVQAVMQEGT